MKVPGSQFYILFLIIGVIVESAKIQIRPSKPTKSRRNFSFAIPAFLLGGGGGLGGGSGIAANGINNGNLPNVNPNPSNSSSVFGNLNLPTNFLRQATVTKTVIVTTSYITVPIFRTCTTAPAAAQFTPCVARQRRGSHRTLELAIIVGSKTLTYPPISSLPIELFKRNETKEESTSGPERSFQFLRQTLELEPSYDSLPIHIANTSRDRIDISHKEASLLKTPQLQFANIHNSTETDVQTEEFSDFARINLAGTTTVTRTYPIVGIVNSTVANIGGVGGMQNVLTISYGGCSPSSLPVTGTPC